MDRSRRITRQIVGFDAADLAAESTFWAALLGGTVDAEDASHTVYADGEPRLGIRLVPNHVPPEWPDGTPQQIHVDLHGDHIKSAHDEAMSLGTRLLKPAEDIESTEGFQVYADPAGHPFCLSWLRRRLGDTRIGDESANPIRALALICAGLLQPGGHTYRRTGFASPPRR